MNATEPKADLFSGIFVPRQVLEDTRLTPSHRILYGLLDGLAKTEAGCYASNNYLAKVVGVKNRQVRNLIKQLEAWGYVSRVIPSHTLGWSERHIETVSATALRSTKGGGNTLPGGWQQIATNIKVNSNTKPPNPLKRGSGRNRKLGKADYSNGF